MDGNGGATTISTSVMSLTSGRRALTCVIVAAMVLNIFPWPARRGARMFFRSAKRRTLRRGPPEGGHYVEVRLKADTTCSQAAPQHQAARGRRETRAMHLRRWRCA